MSLVNDALKRAKEAQKKGQPAAPDPQLRPPELAAAPAGGSGIGMLVPIVIAGIAIVGLSVVWQNRHKAAARELAVPPKPITPVVVVQETKPPVRKVVAPAPKPAAPIVAVVDKPAPAPAVVVSAPAPQLKLQAIFYTPGHSSAMINGKSVKAGDVYRGFRITAITQKSATLVSATQTNVVTLESD